MKRPFHKKVSSAQLLSIIKFYSLPVSKNYNSFNCH